MDDWIVYNDEPNDEWYYSYNPIPVEGYRFKEEYYNEDEKCMWYGFVKNVSKL